jgi:putative endonuclease
VPFQPFTPKKTSGMVYTYVLLSERDGRFYTGSTGDLRARFRDHNAGRVQSTTYRRPLKLIYYEACPHTADARRRKRFLKTGKGKHYLNNRLTESLRVLRTNELERH